MQRICYRKFGLLALAFIAVGSCKESQHPPLLRYETLDDAGVAGADAGLDISIGEYDPTVPPEDTTGLCGNLILPIQTTRPNLYFVLDRSGSMGDRGAKMRDARTGMLISNYDAAWLSIHDVLFALGHRVSYGAAVFPQFGSLGNCDAGREVFPVVPGDPVTYARSGVDGPHLDLLVTTLSRWAPEGSTPTSATMATLVQPLIALGGTTAVVLATDGAPNCNGEITCSRSQCIANIEEMPLADGTACDPNGASCCGPDSYYGPLNCIDADASIAPIAELLRNGIKTYVIGLPGSEAYQTVLGRFAVAGGTARTQLTPTDPLHYLVSDTAALTAALKGITAAFSITCSVTLDSAPPDWDKVNVYFDNGLIRMNPADGWMQVGPSTLEITGPTCDLLLSGDVFQIQVVAGCKTETII